MLARSRGFCFGGCVGGVRWEADRSRMTDWPAGLPPSRAGLVSSAGIRPGGGGGARSAWTLAWTKTTSPTHKYSRSTRGLSRRWWSSSLDISYILVISCLAHRMSESRWRAVTAIFPRHFSRRYLWRRFSAMWFSIPHLVPKLFFLIFRLISILEILHNSQHFVWVLLLLGTRDTIVIEDFLPFLRHSRVYRQTTPHGAMNDSHCPVL